MCFENDYANNNDDDDGNCGSSSANSSGVISSGVKTVNKAGI